jgi:two-component system, NarL family, response regulator
MRERAEGLNGNLRLDEPARTHYSGLHRRATGMSEKIRIVVAEDHLIAHVAVTRIINMEPDMTVVGEALDGNRAVELFRQYLPCVTVLDVRTPRLSGLEAAVAIRAEYPDARLILLTSYDKEEDIRRAFDSGGVGFLTKDVSHGELIKAIRAVNAGHSYVPPKLPAQPERPYLTPRELEVLGLVVRGLSNKQIAYDLKISHETAKNHVKHIFEKLDVRNRTQAATVAFRRGIIDL